MRLGLIRHGKAEDRETWIGADADRTLRSDALDQLEAWLVRLRPQIEAMEVGVLLTSPWERAAHTAAIASRVWGLPLCRVPWLASGAALPSDIAAKIQTHCVMFGHEPDLSALVRWLSGAQVKVKKAGFIELDGEPRCEGMQVRTVLMPGTAQRIVAAEPVTETIIRPSRVRG